jgi:hypothetical protein
MGHEDQFAPLKLRARYRFSKETFPGKHPNTREAPEADNQYQQDCAAEVDP